MSQALLVVEGISKQYDGVQALEDVSFSISAGEIVAIVGPNGAGKTTLFDVVSGTTAPDAGRVLVKGQVVNGRSPGFIAQLGLMRSFQGVRLARRLTVRDNLLLAVGGRSSNPLVRLGIQSPSLNDSRLIEVLSNIGLDVHPNKKVGELSFGDQKLLAMAVCVLAEKEIILLDEPFAGVDRAVVSTICAILRRWRADGRGILIIEHDIRTAIDLSDRIITLSGGKNVGDCAADLFDAGSVSGIGRQNE
jgi:ABC-type branched-subunit amino acid transport system ATPase component